MNPFAKKTIADHLLIRQAKPQTKILAKKGTPQAMKVDSNMVELYLIKQFMDEQECEQIINLAKGKMHPSGITRKSSDKYFRNSSTCHLGAINHDLVETLDNRICQVLGLEKEHSEGLQLHMYKEGEQFKPHTDYFAPNSSEFQKHAKKRGQRTWTFMVYLQAAEKGGGTRFNKIKKTFYPSIGTALFWNNLYPNGQPNPSTMHEGLSVEQGTKVIITKWFRAGPAPLIPARKFFTKHREIPALSKQGFAVRSVPQPTWNLIREAYLLLKSNPIQENFKGMEQFIQTKKEHHPTDLLSFDQLPTLKQIIHEQLRPVHENWCGATLEPTFVYGIRSYRNGATLTAHRDKIETHHISSIILVDEASDAPWPLDIEDHQGKWHKVYIKPGQMILYESAKCKHGRLQPFAGKYFRNFFVHYKLTEFKYQPV